MGILCSGERISAILRRNRWESGRGRVSLKGFLEQRTQMKARPLSLYLTQGAKLGMTSSLFAAGKQISFK